MNKSFTNHIAWPVEAQKSMPFGLRKALPEALEFVKRNAFAAPEAAFDSAFKAQ